MQKIQAVGIDLGTTYSCIAHLNEHGEPVTIPNQEGELSTPSVAMFDGAEVIVGTEALRHAIVNPLNVIQHAKRFLGKQDFRWEIDGRYFSPKDISAFILKKLLSAAEERIGPVESAVITVPAQFSDVQRQQTIAAGKQAGLKQVDLINEPVAASLCYVLGSEGMWFAELAEEQRILVYDLGGGTFDLSLVKYQKDEVDVIASGGDLKLGGIDWNSKLQATIAEQFFNEFGVNPCNDPESLQYLANEVEQAKRSLTVRPKTTLACQVGSTRKTYQITQSQFEQLTKELVEQTTNITKALLKDNKMGWAHVDVVLTTGGSSRMPMVRDALKQSSGTTPNLSLPPDQSIAHGAAYYAGMLLSNRKYAESFLTTEAASRLSKIKQHSVNARSLGFLVRDQMGQQRMPHYLLPANTKLPASVKHTYGTVSPNQRRVHLKLIESGASQDEPFVILGNCVIEGLPADLPVDSKIEVLMEYDSEARVHVSAKDCTSGKEARIEITREQNLVQGTLEESRGKAVPQDQTDLSEPVMLKEILDQAESIKPPEKKSVSPEKQSFSAQPNPVARGLDRSERPVALCNQCGEPQLGPPGSDCSTPEQHTKGALSTRKPGPQKKSNKRKQVQKKGKPDSAQTARKKQSTSQRSVSNQGKPQGKASGKVQGKKKARPQAKPASQLDAAESEFWDLLEDA
ncbi:Hsp70 family protein [uncultured Gimesia sp.]|uniref:Hsp70 family protein n=1 Tax=uncultured Gimesia sp. TaxID=1678688 RepID=UPI0030D74676|tara:strand:- start:73068 stop:75122 length:2055 start_codon:yes stop_codon:yes gene_type:complete